MAVAASAVVAHQQARQHRRVISDLALAPRVRPLGVQAAEVRVQLARDGAEGASEAQAQIVASTSGRVHRLDPTAEAALQHAQQMRVQREWQRTAGVRRQHAAR